MKKRRHPQRPPQENPVAPPVTPVDATPRGETLEPSHAAPHVSSPPSGGESVDFSSTPSREESKVSDFWRFLGLFGACLLFASVAMWLWNVVSLSSGAQEIDTAFREAVTAQQAQQQALQRAQASRTDQDQRDAYQAAQAVRAARTRYEAVLKEKGTEPFRWMMIGFWGVLGYGFVLLHAARERQTLAGRGYGLAGLGMVAFGALYLAYVIGAENHGTALGLVGAGMLGLLLLGLFLMPMSPRPTDEDTGTTPENAPQIRTAFLSGMVLLLLVILGTFAHDAVKTYAEQVNKLKEGSVLAYGLMPLGLLWIVLGLGLCLIYTAQESSPGWRQSITWPLAAVGTVMALAGLGTGLTGGAGQEALVLPYGIVLSILGLIMLAAALARWEGDAFRQRVAWGVALLGLLTLGVAAYRSLEPVLREQFAQQYDVVGFFVPHGFVLLVLGSLYLLVGLGLASDHRFVAMVRRELASLFYSPIAYICLAGLGLFGWLSYLQWLDGFLDSPTMPEPIVQAYMQGFYILFGMMVTLPMFTMRLLSEERRSGTLEMMLTAPVSEAQVVLSKFFGIWLFSMLAFALWMLFPLLLRVYGQEEFDYRPLLSFYLCLACALAHFLAMGLFCSSITRSQIVAFLLALTGMFLLLLPAFLAAQLRMEMSMGRPASQMAYQAYMHLSYIDHLVGALAGRVYIQHLVFHLSACVFWLFVTMKVLETRKWQ